MPTFTFDSVSSDSYGIHIIDKSVYNSAERDVQVINIPGRDGDLVIDNKRWKNVTVEYTVGLLATSKADMAEKISYLIGDFLPVSTRYAKLSDTYDTTSFRMARLKGPIDFKAENEFYATATISFDCKPYRYLNSGEDRITFSGSTRVYNPGVACKPYIKLIGDGDMTLRISSTNYEFHGVSGYIEIDSEAMQCYKGTSNANSKMYTEKFPTIENGNRQITVTGATSVEIVPRWCVL